MDLIDRQQAIGKIKDWMKFIGYSHGERNVMERTIQMLEELPSAQPLNDDWEKYSDLEFSEPYYTDIQVLSQLRSMYNCFDPKEEPIYHALSMAIEALQAQANLDDVSNAYENGYQQGKFEALQWIPCSERLPEYDKDVLCYTDAEEFIVGHRVDNWGQDAWITGEFGDGEFNAIAWMPLPSPYTEEEQ